VVGIESVPHPECVRQDAHPHREYGVVSAQSEMFGRHETQQHAEAEEVQAENEDTHGKQAPAVATGQGTREVGGD
jgi:hypothetical protein